MIAWVVYYLINNDLFTDFLKLISALSSIEIIYLIINFNHLLNKLVEYI